MNHAVRALAVLALVALVPACGGSSGGGVVGGSPEIEVFTLTGAPASAGSAAMGIIALNQKMAVPVMIRNSGTGPLAITGALGLTPTNCTASVQGVVAPVVPAGGTALATILVQAGAAGNPSVLVSVPSDDADENPFTFTMNFTLATTAAALYTTTNANPTTHLISSTFPGVAATAQLDPATTGSGVGSFYAHLLDRALFTCQPLLADDTDLFLKGIGAALPAAATNLTAALSTPTGFFGLFGFTSGDNLWFTYNAGGAGVPTRLYTLTINGATAGAPVDVSGALPVGVPTGVQSVFVSPRRDQIAFLGDFATAGTQELFVVPVAGGARSTLSAALAGGRLIDAASVKWMPDQSGVLYETAIAGQQRELNFAALAGAPAVTRLNGAVAAGRTGVINGSARVSQTGTHVYFLSDEASGTGQREVYVVTRLGGVLSAMTGLNGATVPGTSGVGEYAISPSGRSALFTADSGTAARPDLYLSLIPLSAPTTTRIINSTTNGGVQISAQSVPSDTVGWFLRDDLANGREELFVTDMAAVPSFTRIVDPALFAGGSGTDLSTIYPQPDLRVVFNSNQGGSTKVFSASMSALPGTVNLSTLRNTTSMVTTLGNGVAFEGDNGAAPQEVFFNLATGGAEVQIDGAELGGASSGATMIRFYSQDQVFYQFFTATVDQLWSANTSGVISRNRIDTGGNVNAGSLRLGNEAR